MYFISYEYKYDKQNSNILLDHERLMINKIGSIIEVTSLTLHAQASISSPM